MLRRGADAHRWLVPHAQPFSSRALATQRRRLERLDAMALQHPRSPISSPLRIERPSLAGPFQGVRHRTGRPPADGAALRGEECIASWFGGASGALAMVE